MGTEKFKVACDIDCVLNNLAERAAEIYTERFGIPLRESDFRDYDMSKAVRPEDKDFFKNLFLEEGFWKSLSPVAKAQSALKSIMIDGHTVYLPTSTHYKNVAWKYEWLNKHYPFVPQENVIVIHDKALLAVDVMIDDCLANLLSGSYYRIVIDKPWNRNIRDDVFELIRVKDLAEARTIINELWKNEGMAI
jgi:5'(3')-deoxyribonucleotidase